MKTCPQCGKPFDDPKHPNKVYCSRACFTATHHEIRTCPGCGKEFDSRKGKMHGHKFCSAECAYKHRDNRPADPSKRTVKTCDWCGKEFESWTYRNSRFCSRQCASEYGARQPKPLARKPESFITLICAECGQSFTVHKGQLSKEYPTKYCSRECMYAAIGRQKRGKGNINYRGGTIRFRGPNWNSQRRKAMVRDGYRCQICGRHGKPGRRSRDLSVHHIVPYRDFHGDFERANHLSNLITLCRSCHIQVEFGKKYCPQPLL